MGFHAHFLTLCLLGSLSLHAANPKGLLDKVDRVWNNVKFRLGEELKFRSHQYHYGQDPEVHMNVSQMIRYHGYACEDYTVPTFDGFELSVQHIPHKAQERPSAARPVVFVMHGLLCSSSNWVSNLPNESLGFLLADAGYDVWLGNARGNTYSMKHLKYDPKSEEFWAWSWDEIAKYDLPAMVDFVLNKTGQRQLYYVGHSQGTMMVFAHLSTNPEFAKKIKSFFALGPVATIGHITSPIRLLSHLSDEIIFLLLGRRDFLPNDIILKWLAQTVCDEATKVFCGDVIFVICGFDRAQLNETRLPVYLTHTPAGSSTQNLVHYAQSVRSGKFQMYDHGSHKKNLAKYGQATPPLYSVNNVTVPTYLYWGENDWLADPRDVQYLLANLPNIKEANSIPNWEHLDFIWGLDAATLVYNKIIKTMKEQDLP